MWVNEKCIGCSVLETSIKDRRWRLCVDGNITLECTYILQECCADVDWTCLAVLAVSIATLNTSMKLTYPQNGEMLELLCGIKLSWKTLEVYYKNSCWLVCHFVSWLVVWFISRSVGGSVSQSFSQ